MAIVEWYMVLTRFVNMDEKGIQKASDVVVGSRKVVYKNLLIIGFTLLLSHAAISPTLSLVTTTAGNTLGNITFGLNYFFSCLFSFFTICMLDKERSKKRMLLFGIACIVGFTACNWYVSYYTLIPGTILFGIGVSVSWIISFTYAKQLSVNYCNNYNLNEEGITSFFTGIILGFLLIGYILGNVTTSGVLMLNDSHDNSTILAEELSNFTDLGEECCTNDDKVELSMNMLRGLIVFYALVAFVTVVFLDNLEKSDNQMSSQPKIVIYTWVKSIRFILLLL